MKNFLTLLLCFVVKLCFAQAVITQPNGNVIPNPNLKVLNKGIKVNQILVKNVTALRLSGKNTIEIVKALKQEKVTAKDAFGAVKTTNTPDAENVGALCTAGFTIYEIADALKTDGKTPMDATELLKNSTGCSFTRIDVLKAIRHIYRITLNDLVPIIQSKYTTSITEIVDCLVLLSPSEADIISALATNRLANNRREVAVLLKNKMLYFDRAHLGNVLLVLQRANFGGGDRNRDIADGLLVFEITPIQVLETFKSGYYSSEDASSAIKIAKIAKYLNLTRDDAATFLRRYTYTATQVLDALQAVYGAS